MVALQTMAEETDAEILEAITKDVVTTAKDNGDGSNAVALGPSAFIVLLLLCVKSLASP